jgi:hypothetical protein
VGLLSSLSFQWRWSHVVRTLLAKFIAVQHQAVLPVRKVEEALAPKGSKCGEALDKFINSAGVEGSCTRKLSYLFSLGMYRVVIKSHTCMCICTLHSSSMHASG